MNEYDYSILMNVYVEIPFYFIEGSATNCIIDNELISGLSIDIENNKIIGYPNIIKTSNYTMYCLNSNTTTNSITFRIEVVDNYAKGIIGTYMKCSSFDTTCGTIYTPSSEDISIQTIRIDNSINHKYTGNVSIWDGLSNDFSQQYIVNWDGYLKIEKQGNYQFIISSSDASWVYLNDEIVFKDETCHSYIKNNFTLSLNNGYNLIKIIFVKNFGASGFELIWKEENDSDYSDISLDLYYVKSEEFEYSYKTATYITDMEIPINFPILLDGKTITSCEINPLLPNGLSFISECKISGIPTENEELNKKIEYNITAHFSDEMLLSTLIYITVVKDIKPSNIYLIDNETGNRTEDVNKVLGTYIELQCKTEYGIALTYDIDNIPNGLYFDNVICKLYGVTQIPMNNEKITFFAYGRNGDSIKQEIIFNILTNCTNNDKLHVFKYESNKIINNKKRITLEFITKDEITISSLRFGAEGFVGYSQAVCIPEGKYKLKKDDDIPVGNSITYTLLVDGIRVSNFTSPSNGLRYYNIDTSINIKFI